MGQAIQVDLLALRRLHLDRIGGLDRLFGNLLHHLSHVSGAVDAAERVRHRAFGRDHRNDLELNTPLQVVDREHVGRVGHRHKKFSIQARDRHQLVRLRHIARHQRHHLFRHAQPREVHRRRVQTTAHAEDHVLVGHELPFGQNFQQPAAFGFLNADSFLELIRKKETLLDQHVRDPFAERFTSHERLGPRIEPVD